MACSSGGAGVLPRLRRADANSSSHGIFLAPGRPASRRGAAHLGTAKKNQCLGQITPHTQTPHVSTKWANFTSTAPAMPTVELLLPPSRSLNEVPCRCFEWVCCANAARTKNEIWNLSTRERRRQPIKKPRRVAARLQETNLIHACHDERETSNPTAPTHAASPKQAATDPTLRLRLRMRLQPDLHRLGDRLVATPVLRSIIPHVASPCCRLARRSSWKRPRRRRRRHGPTIDLVAPRTPGVATAVLRDPSTVQEDQSLSSPPLPWLGRQRLLSSISSATPYPSKDPGLCRRSSTCRATRSTEAVRLESRLIISWEPTVPAD